MRIRLAAALAALLLSAAAALGDGQTPGIGCFSPGLSRALERQLAGETLTLEAEAEPTAALMIRDVTVLRDMFAALRLRVRACRADGRDSAELTVQRRRDGLALASAALAEADGRQLLALGGRLFALSAEALPDEAAALLAAAQDRGRLERITPREVRALAGACGLSCLESGGADGKPAALALSGRVSLGGAEWELAGAFVPGEGAKPKDTAEATLTLDEENALSLAYSRQNSESVQRGGNSGRVSANVRLTLEGKLGGNRVSLALSGEQRNGWTLKDGVPAEKITVSTRLDWQDRTPGRNRLHLGRVTLAAEETMTAGASGEWTDAAAFTLTAEGDRLLAGRVNLSAAFGGDPPAAPEGAEEPLDPGELMRGIRQLAPAIAAGIYKELPQKTKDRIKKGL